MSPATTKKVRSAAIFGLIIAAVFILWMAVSSLMATSGGNTVFVFYKVKKTNLPIVVTERGNLESQVQTTIRNKVENVTVDRSGASGTQIITIVPNGSAVVKDQLLVEFDSATIRDRLDTQTLAYQKAKSAQVQAKSKYDNQLIQNETALADAKLAIKLAQLELEMYMDEENGTFQLSVEEIERQIETSKNLTLEARALLELAKVDLSGMKELFRLGYRGKSDLDQSQLKFLQAEDQLSYAVNQMQTHVSTKNKLTEYELKMQKLTLEGAVKTTERQMKQVINDNKALEQQALATLEEAVSSELKEKERLDRLNQQLGNCKLLAPHSGMVVYHRERRGGSEIMEGAMIRERQTILTLPNLSLMQVKTQVHEAVLDQIKAGLPATVKVDAFPDKVYAAVVSSVGVVPSSQGGWFSSSSVKTYDCVVKLVGEVSNLKPGMTAVVNMHIDEIENVMAVPVQAVVQVDRENWCYVETSQGVERRDVQIGRSNDKFVHIVSGLQEGERVVLNSMDVFDEVEEETETDISPENGVPQLSDDVKKAAEDEASKGNSQGFDPGRFGGQQGRPGGGQGRPGGGQGRPGGGPPGRADGQQGNARSGERRQESGGGPRRGSGDQTQRRKSNAEQGGSQ